MLSFRTFFGIAGVALVAGRPTCQVGFGYAERGEPTSTEVDTFKSCQSSCHEGRQCAHFTYDYATKECWLLSKEVVLHPEVSSVSGTMDCEMPRYNRAQETEAQRSHRIHRMVATIAAQVETRSKDEVVRGLAKHVEYSARSGYLKQEKYDNIITVFNAAIADMNSTSLQRLVSYGHIIPTRDDLDWLLNHIVGPQPRAEEMVGGDARNITGDKSGCSDPPCDWKTIGSKSGSPAHSAGEPWTNAEVKYCFDQYIAVSSRSAVDCAIGKIRQELPGIQFINVGYKGRDACNVQPAIFVQSSDSGCWSNIGMQSNQMMNVMGLSGNQKLNLQAPGCNDCGTAIHEMLHAMGMAHEQTRPDRDTFVEIEWDNIATNMYSQFTKNAHADCSLPYDILSIMHYGKFAFSDNGKLTIAVKDAGYDLYTDDPDQYHLYQIGQRTMMTKYDVNQLAKMYDCSSRTVCGVKPTDTPNVDEQTNVHHGPQTDILQGNQGAVILIVGAVVVITLTVALVCICSRKSESKTDDQRGLLMGVDGP